MCEHGQINEAPDGQAQGTYLFFFSFFLNRLSSTSASSDPCQAGPLSCLPCLARPAVVTGVGSGGWSFSGGLHLDWLDWRKGGLSFFGATGYVLDTGKARQAGGKKGWEGKEKGNNHSGATPPTRKERHTLSHSHTLSLPFHISLSHAHSHLPPHTLCTWTGTRGGGQVWQYVPLWLSRSPVLLSSGRGASQERYLILFPPCVYS